MMGPDFGWKEPVPDDWDTRLAALRTAISAGAADFVESELRRLGSFRLAAARETALCRAATKAWALRAGFRQLRPFRLGLVGHRNLAYMAGALPAAGLCRGLLMHAVEFPYGSMEAVASGQVADQGEEGVDAVLAVMDDGALLGPVDLLDTAGEDREVARAIASVEASVESLRRTLRAPVILATLVSALPVGLASIDGATSGTRSRLLDLVNAALREGARAGRWLLWDAASLAADVGLSKWRDPARFHIAKTPHSPALAAVAADGVCRVVAALTGKSGRALVLDLDDTLWGGVVGDDGLEGLRLGQGDPVGEAFQAFQALVLDFHRRGVALAVCSKNSEDVARRAFREHPDMLIRERHIAAFCANWEDKVVNLRALSQILNLGEESLVFVDDNPAERARVREAMPLLKVPEMGSDPSLYPDRLVGSGYLEHLVLGGEDLARTASYLSMGRQAEEARSSAGYESFLEGLRMRMEIRPFDSAGRARIAQLINKSNQFNLTTRRYNEEEVVALAGDPGVVAWQARLSDRFADHGMIAVVIVRRHGQTWDVDTWLQSCRVLKRGVENALMNELFVAAGRAGVMYVTGRFVPTARNGLVRTFFDEMGFVAVSSGEDGSIEYSADVASRPPDATLIEVVRIDATSVVGRS